MDFSSLWFRELQLTGSAMYAYGIWQGQRLRTYEMAVDLLARGDYPAQGLVSHLFPLSDYRRGLPGGLRQAPPSEPQGGLRFEVNPNA